MGDAGVAAAEGRYDLAQPARHYSDASVRGVSLGGRTMKQFLRLAMCLATLAITCGNVLADDALQQNFLAPPVAAKPAVWWFWGETVTTDHGITQDLEALKRVGFGGVVIYEQTFVEGGCRCSWRYQTGWISFVGRWSRGRCRSARDRR
jgi:hypothetical protein